MTRANLILVCAPLAAAAAVSEAAELGYYTQPALHGDRLVFVSEGDLWTATVPAEERPITAWRLTSGDGAETRPCISPDGQRVAFSAEYDGNTDVYVMPIDGGPPTRLTYHPASDGALTWMPDSSAVLFRSSRGSPHGHWELWRVRTGGGMPEAYDFGECSMAAMSSTGRRLAMTRWSNESWTWKRYRGGTAPEIWMGDLESGEFTQLTDDPANDMFPMMVLGRVFFLSDRTGTANIFSVGGLGDDVKQHTFFAPVDGNPTALDGYDVGWPSADAQRRGHRIVFCQAGGLALLDLSDGSTRRLDVRLASDRVAARRRFVDPTETTTGFVLGPEGKRLFVTARGEIVSFDVKTGVGRRHTHTSGAREWAVTPLGEHHLAMVTDASGEQQIAVAPADGSALPWLITEDREAWLLGPSGSPDGKWIAFGDKTHRLHLASTEVLERKQVDESEAWEITDHRFSPDSRWLAYVKPMPSGFGSVHLYSVRTGRTFEISDGLHDDFAPRWDPAGKYLYLLSRTKLNPTMGDLDFDYVLTGTTEVYAVPLAAETPPPLADVARAAGFDLEAWAKPPEAPDPDEATEEVEEEEQEATAMIVDTDGLQTRRYKLPIDAGEIGQLEALWGAVSYVRTPLERLMDDDDDDGPGLRSGKGVLHRYDLVKEEDSTLAEKVGAYAVSGDAKRFACAVKKTIVVADVAKPEDKHEVDVTTQRLQVTIAEEWRHIFNEAWRLQRDFYWAPNYKGVDWDAMKAKYEALLPRVGTRHELNRLIGEMIGELGTSHTYIWGGQMHDDAESVTVGLLGVDFEADGRGGLRIAHILPRHAWDESLESPLAAPHLGIEVGHRLMAVDGQAIGPATNVYALLQDKADKPVRLTLAAEPGARETRDVTVTALSSETPLRYTQWVEDNRRYVDERSEGRIGYVHVPDMGGRGLVAFSRYFYPQIEKRALVVDVRDNNGGFVSQLIIQRLNRRVWAFMRPRHGQTYRYPLKSLHGHMAVLIDQYAGSDGDIFPESFRLNAMGPLIGTRTWGGVVGIRGDKPFVDMGTSTQPEFAWWTPSLGWSVENRGVSPDIEVELTPEDRMAARDPQLHRAIDDLLKRLETDPMEPPSAPPWPE